MRCIQCGEFLKAQLSDETLICSTFIVRLSVDWLSMYERANYSLGVITAQILNLEPEIRTRQENITVLGAGMMCVPLV